jgi:uncharacterized protein
MNMTIEKVGINWSHDGYFMLLTDNDKERRLPISIGQYEAEAIVLGLANIKRPRPLTHDLLSNSLGEGGGILDHIEIGSVSGSTFIGKVVVKRNGSTHEIDARPSDAIAIAIRQGCPIQVAESVLEQAGLTPEKEDMMAKSAISTLWPITTIHFP